MFHHDCEVAFQAGFFRPWRSNVMTGAPEPETSDEAVKRRIREAAARAKAESEARRLAADQTLPKEQLPKELNGRGGPEPARYGDWEVKGIASDF
jgi:hypothetical protein